MSAPSSLQARLHPANPATSSWAGIDSVRVLDALVRNLAGVVFRCAIDSAWSMLFVSEGCEALMGYKAHELLDNQIISYEAVIHPEDRLHVRETIGVMTEGGAGYRVEYRICCKDGAIKWVRERGEAVLDEHGNLVLEGFIEDISDQVAAQQGLLEAELRYRSIFENSVIGIFQTTADGHYLAANKALARLYGYDSPQALISSLHDIATRLYVDTGRREQFKRMMQKFGQVSEFESEVFCRDGSRIWISETAHAVHDSNGNLMYYEGTVQDVTQRRMHEDELEFHATHDALTGLPNRNLLQDRLERAVHLAQRTGARITVAMVDLDNFKFVNDSLGHSVGDQLLVEMSQRLSHTVRSTDTVARYGGDEFVLILSDELQGEHARLILDRLQEKIRQPVVLEGRDLHVNCSIGVSCYPDDGTDLQTLLRHADAAMYSAKQQGKGQYQFFTPALNTAIEERMSLESELRRAIQAEELSVHYQPKVDGKGRVCGFEALARWTSLEFGVISPVRFIPLAEETGLIQQITDFVLMTACREAASWSRRGFGPALTIAVNLSASAFKIDDLPARIRTILDETGLPGAQLELEITESMLVGDTRHTTTVLEQIKHLGVRIAIDDFGTGYSSLSYLKSFPLDVLKIDRSFVLGCERGGDTLAIPSAIISLGHSLGLKVVAEGVENETQQQALMALGCDMYQGFLFARPLDRWALNAFLLDHDGRGADAEG